MRKLLALPLLVALSFGMLVACGHSCVGADELTVTQAISAQAAYKVGPSPAPRSPTPKAPSNNGARPAPKPSGGNTPSKAPSNNGARTNKAPSNNGARVTPSFNAPPKPGGQVHTYTGPKSIGHDYSYAGRDYLVVWHPHSYWDHMVLDPYNPGDYRNFRNPLSPFYHTHVGVPCH